MSNISNTSPKGGQWNELIEKAQEFGKRFTETKHRLNDKVRCLVGPEEDEPISDTNCTAAIIDDNFINRMDDLLDGFINQNARINNDISRLE